MKAHAMRTVSLASLHHLTNTSIAIVFVCLMTLITTYPRVYSKIEFPCLRRQPSANSMTKVLGKMSEDCTTAVKSITNAKSGVGGRPILLSAA